MTVPILASDAFRAKVLGIDDSCAPWLENLPQRLDEVLGMWGLHRDGDPAEGGTSLIFPVRCLSGGRAVLKLVSPVAEADEEARALRVLAPAGAVELLDHSRPHAALLLERLSGPALSRVTDPVRAVRVAGEVAARIGAVDAPVGARSLTDGAVGWRRQLRNQHARACAEERALDSRWVDAAREAIEVLAGSTSRTLTHGDLSLENVMARSEAEWALIDPQLLCGPVEFEAHTVVRGLLTHVLASGSPPQRLRLLVETFCGPSSADGNFALALCAAGLVASHYWEVEHGAPHEQTDQLAAAAAVAVDAITLGPRSRS